MKINLYVCDLCGEEAWNGFLTDYDIYPYFNKGSATGHLSDDGVVKFKIYYKDKFVKGGGLCHKCTVLYFEMLVKKLKDEFTHSLKLHNEWNKKKLINKRITWEKNNK